MIEFSRQFVVPHAIVLALCATAFGTDLNVSVSSGGAGTVKVPVGSTVQYEVTGVLSDANNEGLAAVLFDLAFSGGALEPANTPESGPMLSFALPLGLTNPAGYGGTPTDGVLVQVGGAQNTTNNTPDDAPFPIGQVVTGVAHQPVVLATGTVTPPAALGKYTLSLSNLVANVIKQGEDGVPVWAVEQAGVGVIANLTVEVTTMCKDNSACDDAYACTFDQCLDGSCANDEAAYGDLAGKGGSCGPDGIVDLQDIFAVLNGFEGRFAKGCERLNIDIVGEEGSCEPNDSIDLSDILAVLNAFQGDDRCCPHEK